MDRRGTREGFGHGRAAWPSSRRVTLLVSCRPGRCWNLGGYGDAEQRRREWRRWRCRLAAAGGHADRRPSERGGLSKLREAGLMRDLALGTGVTGQGCARAPQSGRGERAAHDPAAITTAQQTSRRMWSAVRSQRGILRLDVTQAPEHCHAAAGDCQPGCDVCRQNDPPPSCGS